MRKERERETEEERVRRCEDTQRTDAEQRKAGSLGSVWGEEGEMRRVSAARISAPNAQRAGQRSLRALPRRVLYQRRRIGTITSTVNCKRCYGGTTPGFWCVRWRGPDACCYAIRCCGLDRDRIRSVHIWLSLEVLQQACSILIR
jgi:hypothetical protein